MSGRAKNVADSEMREVRRVVRCVGRVMGMCPWDARVVIWDSVRSGGGCGGGMWSEGSSGEEVRGGHFVGFFFCSHGFLLLVIRFGCTAMVCYDIK